MIFDDETIDFKVELKKVNNELSDLMQKYQELEADRDYIKSLLNVSHEHNCKLKKENEQLKQDKKRLIGFLHRYGGVDVEDVDEKILSKKYFDEWGNLYPEFKDGDVE